MSAITRHVTLLEGLYRTRSTVFVLMSTTQTTVRSIEKNSYIKMSSLSYCTTVRYLRCFGFRCCVCKRRTFVLPSVVFVCLYDGVCTVLGKCLLLVRLYEHTGTPFVRHSSGLQYEQHQDERGGYCTVSRGIKHVPGPPDVTSAVG